MSSKSSSVSLWTLRRSSPSAMTSTPWSRGTTSFSAGSRSCYQNSIAGCSRCCRRGGSSGLPRDCRLDRALAELRAWLGELVVAERARLAAEPRRAEKPSNFLEAMLSARDDDGRPFSDDVIFGNLMTMLVAGEDTTAYELGWAVHQLCDSPESVMELRREADELLVTSDVAGDIEMANKLIWAGAVAE